MHYRCRRNHPGYQHVEVCDAWRTFDGFVADMGERPGAAYSIDRIDPHGDYEPGNCRWATNAVQGRNKRNNRLRNRFDVVEYDRWHAIAQTMDYHMTTWHQRLRQGWTLERATMTPGRRRGD